MHIKLNEMQAPNPQDVAGMNENRRQVVTNVLIQEVLKTCDTAITTLNRQIRNNEIPDNLKLANRKIQELLTLFTAILHNYSLGKEYYVDDDIMQACDLFLASFRGNYETIETALCPILLLHAELPRNRPIYILQLIELCRSYQVIDMLAGGARVTPLIIAFRGPESLAMNIDLLGFHASHLLAHPTYTVIVSSSSSACLRCLYSS